MDLSKLSNEDLLALKSGDLSKVSTDGLMSLRGNFERETQAPKNDGILRNVGLGALKGASDIGASLLYPVDKAMDVISPQSTPRNQDRRAALKGFYAENAAPDSLAFKGGELASGIAGTLGVGGAAGGALKLASSTPKAVALAEALRTGGMAKNVGLLNNVLGGAGSSALGTLLLDPSKENIKESAEIGGALPIIGRAAPAVGGIVADLIGGLGTHTGGESLKTAARAGQQGGQAATTFADNMRGNVPMTDVLETAKQNLQRMGQQKAAEYRAGMAKVSSDKSVLSFNGIDQAVTDAGNITKYKGQVTNPRAAQVQQDIADQVAQWKALNTAEYHTPEGLDALKRRIGDIAESIPFEEKTARKVGSNIYNSVKNEITQQAPAYAKTMQGYSEASDTIHEIERALSLGNKASADTAMRKLQSLTRNNVNTNYGNRLNLAQQLEQQGGQEIMPALAGQSLSSWTPRGLGGLIASGTGGAAIALQNPALVAALAMQSPRLMGEAALKTGQGARLIGKSAEKIAPTNAALIKAIRGD